MVIRSFILLFCFFFLGTTAANAQACAPPENPVVYIDGFAGIYQVGWNTPASSDCAILYYEVEYSGNPFTPGTGQGTLISPVLGTAVDVPNWVMYAWVRSICDCEGGPGPGEGDGIPDAESAWVEATLFIPVYPDPSFECGIVEVTVASPTQCGSSPSEMNFIAVFSDFPETTPSCLSEPQYILWTSFDAPVSGSVSISMATSEFGGGEFWNDFGLIVLESCLGTEIYCEASYTDADEVIVTGLTPGEDYVIGNWNNGYPYQWSQNNGGVTYNGTTNLINVCEVEEEEMDFSVTAGPLLTIECTDLEPQPTYDLGSSWGNDTQVTSELMLTSTCGDTSYFFITVSDTMGHTATATQTVIIDDTNPPEIIMAEDMTIACDEGLPEPDYFAVDICSGVVVTVEESIVPGCIDSYDFFYTVTATDGCGNSSVAIQQITVIDSVPPVFGFCPDSIYFNTDMATITMTDLTGNSNFDISDNCAEELILEQSIPPGTNLEAGIYPIEFTLTDNCANETLCQSLVVVSSTVGIKEHLELAFRIFPNPARNEFYVEMDSSMDRHLLSIFDIEGRELMQVNLGRDGWGQIPIEGLAGGTYLIVILDERENTVGRKILVKQ